MATICEKELAYKRVSSAYRAFRLFGKEGISDVYILNRRGPRTDPWGTPAGTVTGADSLPSTLTRNVLRWRYSRIIRVIAGGKRWSIILYSNPSIQTTRSNAFSRSTSTSAVCWCLLRALTVSASIRATWCSVECRARKPNCSGGYFPRVLSRCCR